MPKRKKKTRGGKRPGAGRPKSKTIRLRLTVRAVTAAKINRMRKAGELWKRQGEVLDEVFRTISVEGAAFLDLAV